jgi:AbrB family looped-hinge helix DNA binding protein
VLVKTVKVSSKGQITLPKSALDAIGATQGTEFVLVQDDARILLVRADRVGRDLVEDLAGWEGLAATSFAEVWDDPENAVWDTFGEPPRKKKKRTPRRKRG